MVPGEIERTDEDSLGASTSGTHVPKVSVTQVPCDKYSNPGGVPWFNLVVEMMEALKAEAKIKDATLVDPPDGVAAGQRGKHKVWRLAAYRARLRRSLLVYPVRPSKKALKARSKSCSACCSDCEKASVAKNGNSRLSAVS